MTSMKRSDGFCSEFGLHAAEIASVSENRNIKKIFPVPGTIKEKERHI